MKLLLFIISIFLILIGLVVIFSPKDTIPVYTSDFKEASGSSDWFYIPNDGANYVQ